jgi:hypothetical protein
MLDLNKDALKKENQLPEVGCEPRASKQKPVITRLSSDSDKSPFDHILSPDCDAREEVKGFLPRKQETPESDSATANAKTIVGEGVRWHRLEQQSRYSCHRPDSQANQARWSSPSS